MIWFNRTLFIRGVAFFLSLFNWVTLLRQNYKSAFGLLFALLFLISNLVPFLPQNGFASMLFEEDPTEGSKEKHRHLTSKFVIILWTMMVMD